MTTPLALVAAAGGLGDVLRATPLVRVFRALGYEVDLLVAPDYAGTVTLLEGAPEVRRLFSLPSSWASGGETRTEGLADTRYGVAAFSRWASRPLGAMVRAARVFAFGPEWVAEGDSACVERIARAAGFSGHIPAPFAVHSGRVFDEVGPGTVALHPGCKAGWPWKKWHGFPDLAAEFSDVAVVGADEDRRTDGTYFASAAGYAWPPHARDFTGALSLADTAALLSRCGALVSNDSGLMHLGVALGIPVFGVFGITSPAREAVPAPNMLPVTRGLPCEPQCRRQPWGRRDCHRRLECLRTLGAAEVAARVRAALPHLAAPPSALDRGNGGGSTGMEIAAAPVPVSVGRTSLETGSADHGPNGGGSIASGSTEIGSAHRSTRIPSIDPASADGRSVQPPSIEPPSIETPSTGTPSTGTPSIETPSTGTPSSGTPSTETPSTEAPSTETPSIEIPSVDTRSIETPSIGTPSTGTASTEIPSTEIPSTGTPSTETPSTEAPSTETPSIEIPSIEIPSVDTRSIETPSVADGPRHLRSTGHPPTEAAGGPRPDTSSPSPPMSDLSVVYYGYVSDHSGYGHTARAYVHALHGAGVRLRVVDLARRRTPPPDALVTSLMSPRVDGDVHLFHGIPPQWARLAFPHRNAVGMTVWETDRMPSQWRNALNHVADVWLPCAFNVDVFARELEKPVFRLPHPVFPPRANGDTPDGGAFLGVDGDEFVFYALFEWQDRKGPHETLAAFLTAFSADDRAVLVLKTNPGAADLARRALAEAREKHRSDARVEIRAEAWSEAGVEALHRRGDCYVSLHRGEGWGYPLFEAAGRGKPVVATAYSGPLDYLDADAHALVRWTPAPVRQPYLYYSPKMRWAEPDVAHAAEQMRRVFDDRAAARARAGAAAGRLRETFSLAAVGAAARARLEEVRPVRRVRAAPPLADAPPVETARVRTAPAAKAAVSAESVEPPFPPEGPVPAEWYDRDYFETGRKSNWSRGYSWALFGGLFRDTAGMLAQLLPDAASYLDAGCAKGFLVRALREKGKNAWGFDASAWAVEQADPAARPYLTHASVDDADFDRAFDVLVAAELFQTLTPAQLDAFLPCARQWTTTALVAVIPSFETDAEAAAHRPGGNDRTHVTLRTRAWWHERLTAAGWRQDPLHRVVESLFRAHPLVRRMGWKVFVYAP